MQQEIRFATFNVCNLALPGMQCYANLAPYTPEEYEAKTAWIARQIDSMGADVIGFQEIFSQAALRHVLAKTKNYRQASLVGFDPDPTAAQLTPSVALVSRLPLASNAIAHIEFPHSLSVPLPDGAAPITRFTRPILQARVVLSDTLSIHVIVLHFKSKLPDYAASADQDDPYKYGMASLRSHIRRGAEALGLRYLLIDIIQGMRMPLVMLGDFNDGAKAASTQIVMGAQSTDRPMPQARLFDSYDLQSPHHPQQDAGYTIIHEGNFETIDHILVSDDFNPASPAAIGEVCEVIYFHDHIAPQRPEASDHAQVVARIRLYAQ